MDYLYRYEINDHLFETAAYYIALAKYPIVEKTKKGVWISPSLCSYEKDKKWKFVLYPSDRSDGGKRFAYPSIDLAWKSLEIRTSRRAGILKTQIDRVTASNAVIKKQNGVPLTERFEFWLKEVVPNVS